MDNFLSFLAPPLAAGVGIVPAYVFFARKSAKQVQQPTPKITFRDAAGAAPKVATIVGTQMVAQMQIEHLLNTYVGGGPLSQMMGSSFIVGGISVPALAVFNGHTLGWTVARSLKALDCKQTGAILTRETSFLLSLRMSSPVCAWLMDRFGGNKVVEYAGAFFTGSAGSLLSHPADTALTRWQKGMRVQSADLMRGAGNKAFGVGIFSVVYRAILGTVE